MKTTNFVKRLALGVMFVFVLGSVAFAGEGEKGKSDMQIAPYLNTDYSVISLSNKTDKTAVFKIVDDNGEVYYKEWVKKDGLSQKVLDFAHAEDGTYRAILKVNGSDDLTETFIIKNHKLVTPKQEVSEEELRAFFNLVENTLYVSHITFGSNSFGISIADSNREDVFVKSVEGNSTYSGKFDISALPIGQYTVSINSGDSKYSYEFQK
ncbi:hypothetical protein [Labilibacter marinus]|uniref:hypothetical protein n=1 Tax=Labilibacter marinus TaxID=1477105 RepID=UPI000832355D|nr:hypothetical protein [Labilibacter marinus]